MNKSASLPMALLAMSSLLPAAQPHPGDSTAGIPFVSYRSTTAISCSPDRTQLAFQIANTPVYLLPGSGSYDWGLNSTVDSARLYFNQGINTYYGFHIIESLASFKKALSFDSDHPMLWWGVALAYGPNINDMGYTATPEALDAAGNAFERINDKRLSPSDRALIAAMHVRYSADTGQSREVLNQQYADAMKSVFQRFPQQADAAALYADALMLQHPWDLYGADRLPRAWTPEIRKVLEQALSSDARHPGANHYYIHIVEGSARPEEADRSAGILGELTPGLAHMVHMPSHIYLRTGEFARGVKINQQAVDQFGIYSALFPPAAGGAFIYYLHNQHMLANCAMHAGNYKAAYGAAAALQQAIDSATLALAPPLGSLVQYVYMSPILIHTRFEKWDSLLSIKPVHTNFVYANLLYHFGRGMALAGKGRITDAKKELVMLNQLLEDSSLAIPLTPFSSAKEGGMTASGILRGSIAMKEKNYDAAIIAYTEAAETEEKMVYNEPRDWFLNPYQYLGNAYAAKGDVASAEKIYKKDLEVNAKNVWSLHRLSRLPGGKGVQRNQSEWHQKFTTASHDADVDFSLLYY